MRVARDESPGVAAPGGRAVRGTVRKRQRRAECQPYAALWGGTIAIKCGAGTNRVIYFYRRVDIGARSNVIAGGHSGTGGGLLSGDCRRHKSRACRRHNSENAIRRSPITRAPLLRLSSTRVPRSPRRGLRPATRAPPRLGLTRLCLLLLLCPPSCRSSISCLAPIPIPCPPCRRAPIRTQIARPAPIPSYQRHYVLSTPLHPCPHPHRTRALGQCFCAGRAHDVAAGSFLVLFSSSTAKVMYPRVRHRTTGARAIARQSPARSTACR